MPKRNRNKRKKRLQNSDNNIKFSAKKKQNHPPIFRHKNEIVNSVTNNKVVIITGQTGCGKSTQVPQYLYENGFHKNGIIACLHPRCIAAMTLSQRVAEEMGTEVGYEVGYQVRFYNMHSRETKIMFMTVGFLLRTLMDKSKIKRYSVIIVDEAHERCVETDLMLAKMKILMNSGTNLKLIIMSATLDAEILQKYFDNCPIIRITPIPSNVQVVYKPPSDEDYVKAIKNQVIEIARTTTSGHILIFLPTEGKIRRCKKLLESERRELKQFIVLKLFSSMDYEHKLKVFLSYDRRKIIISTNVAETSLTIDDVQFVIDSGKVIRVRYDNETQMEHWNIKLISLAEAEQRRGRAGRTVNGMVPQPFCYRMFPKRFVEEIIEEKIIEEDKELKDINNKNISDQFKLNSTLLLDYPKPDILKVNLSFLILFMKSLGMPPIENVDFPTSPNMLAVRHATRNLIDLSLLREDESISKLGLEVIKIPLDPRLGKVVHISLSFGVWREVIAIASMVSVGKIFKNEIAMKYFSTDYGDLFMLRDVFFEYYYSRDSKEWCKMNYINRSSVDYAYLVYEELLKSNLPKYTIPIPRQWENCVTKCFLSGYFTNIAINVKLSDKNLKNGHLDESCLAASETEMILFTSVKKLDRGDIVFKNCISFNKDLLDNVNTKKFKIKSKLWNELVDLKQIKWTFSNFY